MRRRPAGPDVQRDRAEVGQVEQRSFVVADEVVDVPLGLSLHIALGPNPVGHETGRVLLKEGLSVDPVGIAGEHHGAVGEIRAESRARSTR